MKVKSILFGGLAVLLCLAASSSPLGIGQAHAQQLIGPTPLPPPPGVPEVIPGQFIVELRPGVNRDAFINEHRVAAFHHYTLINGFAARMSQTAADRLAADARVRSVHPDLVVRAFAKPSAPGGGGGNSGGGSTCPDTSSAMSDPQIVPTGISRIGASSASTTGTGAGVKVAVIDTGIDLCHPDLKANLKGGVNLLAKKPPTDDHGHGTHVAGIIGAVDNAFGVVGVAPQAALYAVKVLDKDGSGSLSTAIKGLDWAAKNQMKVANLSLGAFDFSLGSGPMCTAVANAVAAGVTVVAAAGNSAFEALYFTPANCPDSLTVSAFVDLNGIVGGDGSVTINEILEYDDTFADSFSNYSDYCWDLDGNSQCSDADTLIVSLMAPGVEILSTLPTSSVTLNDPTSANKQLNYDTLTGTSMAAPHVAGAAALYCGANPGATPKQVRAELTTGGMCPDGTGGHISCPEPWLDDYDSAWEPLLYVGSWGAL